MNFLTNIMIFIFLSGVFLSGSISMIEDWKHLSNIVLLLSCMGIIIVYLFNFKFNIKIPRILTIIFTGFLFFMMLSSLVNSSSQMFLSASRYLLIFITLCLIVPVLLKEKALTTTIWSFLLSQIPLLILSLTEQNPFSNPSVSYLGIFYNPNSFGTFSATIFIILLVLYYSLIGTRRHVVQFLLLLLLFYVFMLVSLSGSRTSFLAIIIILFLTIILYIAKYININSISLKRIGYIFISFIGFGLFVFWFLDSRFYEVLNERIIEKFITKFNSGDVLDQRGKILTETIKESSLFGHGPDYFIENFGLGAHNSFVSILGQYGLLVNVLFIIFWMYATFKSIKYFNNSNNKYRLLPVTIIMFFLITSMTEIMLMRASMLVAFVAIGVICLENKMRYGKTG